MDERTIAGRPGRRWFAALLWVHRWSSLVATPFFLVLCVTGSVLVFHAEIDRAFGWAPQVPAAAVGAPLPPSRLVAAANATDASLRPLSYAVDRDEPGIVFVTIGPRGPAKANDGKTVRLNASTAAIMTAPTAPKTPTDVLLDLHANWLSGPRGQLFGGLVAVAVLVSLLSGIAIYAPYLRDAIFRLSRRSLPPRAKQVELHIVVGLVVFGWAAIVATTGIAQSLSTVAFANWQGSELRDLAATTRRTVGGAAAPGWIGIDPAIAAAASRLRGEQVTIVMYPQTDFSTPDAFVVYGSPARGVEKNLLDVVAVNAATGSASDVHSLPLYLKAILVGGPLHFGDYGGIALKLLWLACAWSTLFITGNGMWLWWIRRSRRSPLSSAAA